MKRIIISLVFLLSLSLSYAAHVNVYDKHSVGGWVIHVDSDLARAKPEDVKVALSKFKKSFALLDKKLPKLLFEYARQDGLKIFLTSSTKIAGRKGMLFVPKNNYRWTRNFERLMDNSIVVTSESVFLLDSFRFSYYLIHEFSHYYHLEILGYNNEFILKKYETAKRDVGYRGTHALNNHMEFFAELSARFFMMNNDLVILDKDAVHLMEYLWGDKMLKSEIAKIKRALSIDWPDWEKLQKAEAARRKLTFGRSK